MKLPIPKSIVFVSAAIVIAAVSLFVSVCAAEGTALTQVIHEQINTAGDAKLAQGYLKTDRPIVLRRRSGVTIDGCGRVRHGQDYPHPTWKSPKTMRGTEIVYTGPPEEPAILIEDCSGVTLSNLSIRCTEGGDAIAFRTGGWGGNNHHTLDRVHIATEGRGVVCGGGSRPWNSADIDFRHVTWRGCSEAFVTLDWQNVGYHFYGCYWYGCDTLFHLIRGGNVYVFGGGCNSGVGTLWDLDAFGSNLSPCLMYGFRADRSGTTRLMTVVDGSDAESGSMQVDIRAFNLIRKASDKDAEPFPLVKFPQSEKARLRVTVTSHQVPPNCYWPDGVWDLDAASAQIEGAKQAIESAREWAEQFTLPEVVE